MKDEKKDKQNPARKKPYTPPKLTVHGRLEDLTKDKASGGSDKFGFSGITG